MNLRKVLATALLAAVAAGATVAFQAGSASPTGAPANPVSAAPREHAGSSSTGERSPEGTGTLHPGAADAEVTAERAATALDVSVSVQGLLHRPGQAVEGTDSGQWSSMYDFMSFVVQDAASVWSWYYQQWGYQTGSAVRYSFPLAGQQVVTGCGDTTNDTTMEYCSNDDTIYFSQALATRLWDGSYLGPDKWQGKGGDFAVATMLAHEYGHNVQAELGISNSTYGVAKHEQHADCFSGAFAHVAYYQGILDANDVAEGITTAYVVGDSWFDNPGHHGTPDERMAAWKLGYNSAGPAACDAVLG